MIKLKTRVVIPYREPTYETYKGRCLLNPYRASFVVVAYSIKGDIRKALELFKQDQSNAHVGRERAPEHARIEVEPL